MNSTSEEKRSNLVDVGRLSGVFGVKGWIKVRSFTEPQENILSYKPWCVKSKYGVRVLEVDDFRFQTGALVVHFKGIDDRDEVAKLNLASIAIEREQLPELGEGDFYWDQLIGLRVVSRFGGESRDLGVVAGLMETGANDVLVCAPDEKSIDDRERLIPYIPELYVLSVDADSKLLVVDWDPEF